MRPLLESIGLITDPEVISDCTRDSPNIRVMRDKISGVIWNEGFDDIPPIMGLEYWGAKTLEEARAKTLIDDMRRAAQFKKYLKGKTVLDFGCGHGGFIKQIEGIARRTWGCDRNYVSNDFDWFEFYPANTPYDVITAFHVVEHLEWPIDCLKGFRGSLKPHGHLIVEVPHASDFLIRFLNCDAFKKFTFWSDHRILHTRESLRLFLEQAGFKNIKIEGYQRYGLNNHMHWLAIGKPGGFDCWQHLKNDEYIKMLQKYDATDTLVAIAEA